ncbi:MAG: metalloregulator ArsR/SmtB family transcription factor, partial [Veillonella sp.]|nr:metalloregulator ArsR/SmtB family transcription factor [Veillonella sp.]MDU8008972.1 metalloregulator ArsR/SmtB family transcription factor [Veillonella sp.]
LIEIQKQSSFLREKGFIEMFNHLQIDRIHWEKDALSIIKPFDQEIHLKDSDSIMLLPSYFIWPHLFVEPFNQGIAITYDIMEQPSYYNSTPEELVTIFKALSDSVRLQIMNYILEKPCTTQSLAQILLMTDSSVSRHLQILKDAKLLKARKVKKFVLYEPTELVTQLMPNFYRFFRN